MGLSTFRLPSNINVGNAGLSANKSGGIQSKALPKPVQTYNPINYGYTTPSVQARPISSISNNTGILGANTANLGGSMYTGGAAPSTGGQAAAPAPSIPQSSGPQSDPYLDQIRGAYQQSADALKGMIPGLDSSYTAHSGEIQSSIDKNQALADQTKQTNNQTFGDLLKNEVQTYRQLGQQQNGTYSQLGTLDSSSYQDAQQKAAQDLSDNQAKTQLENTKQNSSIDSAMQDYKAQGVAKLADLASTYQQGKTAIAQALANNDLASASAIQQHLQEVQAQAQNVQNSILNFGLQAATLTGYGKDVAGQIQGATGSNFVNSLLGSLNNVRGLGQSMYNVPTSSGLSGQGYINSNGKKVDPYTGQVVG